MYLVLPAVLTLNVHVRLYLLYIKALVPAIPRLYSEIRLLFY